MPEKTKANEATEAKVEEIVETTKNNQNAEEVKNNLDTTLKDMGLTKANHRSIESAVNRLFGDKRVGKDRSDYLIIGKFAHHADEHLRAQKSKNTGKFKAYIELYFPRMQAAEVSHSMWYFRNAEAVDEWLAENPDVTAASPGRIRRLLVKWLKDEEATEKEVKAYGLKFQKKPAKKAAGKANTIVEPKEGEGVEAKNSEGETVRSRPFKNMAAAELVEWLHAGMMELVDRGEHKESALEFDHELLVKVEKISNGIADSQIEIEEKLKKAGLKAA